MPNVNRIHEVADAIEASHYSANGDQIGFNMGSWLTRSSIRGNTNGKPFCGTTACIAGWAWVSKSNDEDLKDLKEKGWAKGQPKSFFEYGRREFDLTHLQALRLFTTKVWCGEEVHPLHAVETLRHLAETGSVSWTQGYRRYLKRLMEEAQRQKEWKEALTYSAEVPLNIELNKEKSK